MDKDTFDRIRDLRGQAARLAYDHEPPAAQEHGDTTPGQRFKALGQFVMNNDRHPRKSEFGDMTYRVHVSLPDRTTVNLTAETMRSGSPEPPLDELFRVQAEWGVGGSDPMHVDSVANISDNRTPYDADLKKLALVEESFAAAKPHV